MRTKRNQAMPVQGLSSRLLANAGLLNQQLSFSMPILLSLMLPYVRSARTFCTYVLHCQSTSSPWRAPGRIGLFLRRMKLQNQTVSSLIQPTATRGNTAATTAQCGS